jgi:hypothetical protein
VENDEEAGKHRSQLKLHEISWPIASTAAELRIRRRSTTHLWRSRLINQIQSSAQYDDIENIIEQTQAEERGAVRKLVRVRRRVTARAGVRMDRHGLESRRWVRGGRWRCSAHRLSLRLRGL